MSKPNIRARKGVRGKTNRHKPWTMKKTGSSGEIMIYDDIDPPWMAEMFGTTSAKSFDADLKALGEVEHLDVRINSPGGSVFEGVAIFNQLKRHKARVAVQIDGIAASIASVIAMAGDEISIAKNAMMMIHNPAGIAMGEAAAMRRMADSLDMIRGTILDTYADRSGASAEELGARMDAETWLTAEGALALGLVDVIGPALEISARFDLSNYRNAPRGMRAGPDLAAELNGLIDERESEERSRDDIIDDMAREADIDRGTVLQILSGDINCPPLQRLEGFARALDVSTARLRSAAENDGCNYESDPANRTANRRCRGSRRLSQNAAPAVPARAHPDIARHAGKLQELGLRT